MLDPLSLQLKPVITKVHRMAKVEKSRFGKLAPSYNFVLNPYPSQRFSRCPSCEGKTGQRKLPLHIHIDPMHLLALNYTCRYCKHCDLLIAHKHEIEHLLLEFLSQRDPGAIGNDYLIIGTVGKKAWREGLTKPKTMVETLAYASDFKTCKELRLSRPGWYRHDQEPLLWEPPPSQEWIRDTS